MENTCSPRGWKLEQVVLGLTGRTISCDFALGGTRVSRTIWYSVLTTTWINLASGCVTEPMDHDDIGATTNVEFAGYSTYASRRVCFYSRSSQGINDWNYEGYTTSSSSGLSLDGLTGYPFSSTKAIDAASWSCAVPSDGTGWAYLRVEERTSASGGCTSQPSSGNQSTLQYTYETGTVLSDCYYEAGDIYGMPAECGNTFAYAPEIKVYASELSSCEPACEEAADCDDSNECTANVCSWDRTNCSNPNEAAGTPCETDKVCDGSGLCVTPECDVSEDCDDSNDCTVDVCVDGVSCSNTYASAGTSCGGGTGECDGSGVCDAFCEDIQPTLDAQSCPSGQEAYQLYPWVGWNAVACAVDPPEGYCFINNCGAAFQFWAAYDTQSECENANPNFVWYARNPGGIRSGGALADCRARNQP